MRGAGSGCLGRDTRRDLSTVGNFVMVSSLPSEHRWRRFPMPGPGAAAAHRPAQRRLHQQCNRRDRHGHVALS